MASSACSSGNRVNGDRKIQIPCRFFERGTCKFGDTCRFFHDTSALANAKDAKIKIPPLKVSITSHESNWAEAVEFVPGASYQPRESQSYSQTTQINAPQFEPVAEEIVDLCPYNIMGNCRYKDECIMLHGNLCEMCGLRILHPTDVKQQEKHKEECLSVHEEDMKESFKMALNQDIACGICMEKIVDKTSAKDRKFGILENCNHAFCLSCIRQWRSAKSFKSSVVKSCPECRVASTFVTPSDYWIDDKEEKANLIKGYKEYLSKKPCMHFKKGKGRCPFGVKCFYMHQNADGSLQDRSKPDRFAQNGDGQWRDMTASLFEFFGDNDDNNMDNWEIEETLEWLDLLQNFGGDVDGDYLSEEYNWFDSDSDSDPDFFIL